MTDEQTEDTFEQERVVKSRQPREAKELLNHPMLKQFFEDSEKQSFVAFGNLPLDTKLEEFQIVWHDLRAVRRLKRRLDQYVADFKMLELRDGQVDVEGI